MPTNKHASFRYRVLNQCFSNRGRRKWRLDELISEVSHYLQEEFGANVAVGRRTIEGDIQLMRSRPPRGYNAPIVCKDSWYYYEDPEFSIERPPLRQEDLLLIREAISLAKQMPGMPHLPLLDLMLQRLEGGNNLSALSTYIQFETNPMVHGLQWIAPIYQAIVTKQVLRVWYHPFLEQEIVCEFHPYLLKEWRNRWFAFGRGCTDGNPDAAIIINNPENWENIGFVQNGDRLWNLPLDRIAACEVAAKVAHIPNTLFDPATWFTDIVGISKPANRPALTIEIESDPIASYYLETKPLHPSQRLLSRDAERAVFSLHLIPNNEIVFDLLAYGKHIEVRSPESFKAMVQERRGCQAVES